MRKSIENSQRKKAFLIQCILAFLAVILTLTLFFIAVQIINISSMRKEIVDITQQKFDASVATMERYFDQMKYTYAEISTDPALLHIAEGESAPDFNYTKVITKIRTATYTRKQNEFLPFLDVLCLVTPAKNKMIVDSEGTYSRDSFFTIHMNSSKYSDAFWQSEMRKNIVFETYPVATFTSVNNTMLADHVVMPIAYKLPSNNNFLFVSLFNVNAALTEATKGMGGNMILLDDSRHVIYPQNPEIDVNKLTFNDGQAFKKISGNYVFASQTGNNKLTYYYSIPGSVLFANEHRLAWITFLICILALSATICFAVFISVRFNRSIVKIAERVRKSGCFEDSEISTENALDFINRGIHALAEKNQQYLSEIEDKDSLLKGIFLQSRMRDIYVSIEDVEKKINVAQSYVMVYMRVHYKDEFYRNVAEEQGKSTFFLKQLIELYLASSKNEVTTFQIENDQIVSVINVAGDNKDVLEMVQTVTKKLENESDYVFFTIVVSQVHDNVAELKMNFDHLSELSKYAMPDTETQILVEGEVKQGAGRFYFTIEQMEKLSALMQNESLEECIRDLNEILDYNVKKKVNGFDLYLLCTEIVSCGVKLVNRLFHATPPSLRISQVYAQLDKAVTLEQYQKICVGLIREIVEYIHINKREEDYIISFILEYVENHYAEDIYLNLFAEKLKLTAAYISSYFKEKMNVNLSDYINSFRIKKAVQLIENPQNKNKDVASMVGLQNINTFIRLFKKYTGYTPGEYKKKHFSD